MLHIWHEDKYIGAFNNHNSATQKFWEFLKVNNVDNRLSNAEIIGFNSNSKLLDHIKHTTFNTNDIYIIFIDYAKSNSNTVKIYRDAEDIVNGLSNVYLPKVICFEHLILEFKYFDTWLKPTDLSRIPRYNTMKQIRSIYLQCISSSINWKKDPNLVQFMANELNTTKLDIMNKKDLSEEKLATYIVSEYTKASNNFRIDKTTLDICWVCDCCKRLRGYPTHSNIVPCNIYRYNKTANEKANNLWNCTEAKTIVSRCK